MAWSSDSGITDKFCTDWVKSCSSYIKVWHVDGILINKMPSDSVSRIDPGLASYQQDVYSTVMPDAKFYCEAINVFEIKKKIIRYFDTGN